MVTYRAQFDDNPTFSAYVVHNIQFIGLVSIQDGHIVPPVDPQAHKLWFECYLILDEIDPMNKSHVAINSTITKIKGVRHSNTEILDNRKMGPGLREVIIAALQEQI
jgi:hypothetical protein